MLRGSDGATVAAMAAETRRRLRQASPTRALAPGPSPGSRLMREWKGVAQEVEVVADGFIHDGRKFNSLSQVARAITGVRWNGPRFFGLRGEEQDR